MYLLRLENVDTDLIHQQIEMKFGKIENLLIEDKNNHLVSLNSIVLKIVTIYTALLECFIYMKLSFVVRVGSCPIKMEVFAVRLQRKKLMIGSRQDFFMMNV